MWALPIMCRVGPVVGRCPLACCVLAVVWRSLSVSVTSNLQWAAWSNGGPSFRRGGPMWPPAIRRKHAAHTARHLVGGRHKQCRDHPGDQTGSPQRNGAGAPLACALARDHDHLAPGGCIGLSSAAEVVADLVVHDRADGLLCPGAFGLGEGGHLRVGEPIF